MPVIEDLVNYAIIIAIAAAMILMITGRFIDLSVDRQEAVQSRATINLLQNIVTNAPFLMEDSGGNKMKLMIDRGKYQELTSSLAGCCDSVQYDYKFLVGEYKGLSPKRHIASPIGDEKTNYAMIGYEEEPTFDLRSYCYTGFSIGQRRAADVPVNICDGDFNKCALGVARLETLNSPLTQMSYWITQACASKTDFSKRIPLADKDYESGNDITILRDSVCFGGACKKFECGIEIRNNMHEGRPLIDDSLLKENVRAFPLSVECDFVRIVKDGNMVTILEGILDTVRVPVPEEAKSLPEDLDSWTEGISSYFHAKNPDNFAIGNEMLPGIAAEEGESYVTLSPAKPNNSWDISKIHDQPIYLEINLVEEADDCQGTRCINMEGRYLRWINFHARVSPEELYGPLTWKLRDEKGGCILPKNKERIGSEWERFSIDRLDQRGLYERCDDSKSDYESFTWNITQVEWNICEGWKHDKECFGILNVGSIETLMIDKFHFGVDR